jgi:signal peptidase II
VPTLRKRRITIKKAIRKVKGLSATTGSPLQVMECFIMLYIIIAILAVALDQLFKYYITATLAAGSQISLIPGIIHLTYLENTGAAFSFMSGMRWILVGISVVCAVIILIIIYRARFGMGGKILLSLVLGGALGNLIDRAWHGYVVDMFEVEFMDFAVFNIADIFITVAGALFVIYYFVYSIKSERRSKKDIHNSVSPVDSAVSKTPTIRLDDSQEGEELNYTASQILEEYSLEKMLNEESNDNNGNPDA